MNYIEIDGGTLAVEVRGSGPLVVCSPAMGDSRDAYDAFVDALVQAGFRTAQFDLRGHGDSTTGFRHHGDEATADDVLAVIDELGDGPAFVAGASLSAGAAVIAAGRRPDAVAGMVLLAPFLRNPGGAFVRRMLHVMVAGPWGPMIWGGYSKRLWPGLGADGAASRARTTMALLRRPGRWAAFVATVDGADHRVVEPWIRRVTAPALVVIGSADPDWKDPLAEAAWVAGNFGAEVVVADGAGHAPMLERPDVVGPAAVRFLQGVTSATRGA